MAQRRIAMIGEKPQTASQTERTLQDPPAPSNEQYGWRSAPSAEAVQQ